MFKVIFVCSVIILIPALARNQFKLTSLKCFVLNAGLIKLDKCFVKAISRDCGSFNLALTLSRVVSAPVYVLSV